MIKIGSILTIGNENKRCGGLNESGPHKFYIECWSADSRTMWKD